VSRDIGQKGKHRTSVELLPFLVNIADREYIIENNAGRDRCHEGKESTGVGKNY
jgi:hypothetical protein